MTSRTNPVKVKFTETYTVKSVGGATYEKGSVYEVRKDSAMHFIGLGVAIAVEGGEVSEPKFLPQPPLPPPMERELTTSIDLGILFARHRHIEFPELAAKEPEKPKAEVTAPKEEPLEQPAPVIINPDPIPQDALVSCIMPTLNRREFIPAAIDSWLKQTYKNRELIVVDDGDDRIKDLIPKNKRLRIRYIELKEKVSTGTKRNLCCEAARGEIICHFDDDDWSAPDRIEDQVRKLRETNLPITGYGTLLFWDVVGSKARRFEAVMAGYVCGTTLCYRKSWWKDHRFPDKHEGSDNAFIYPALKHIAASHDAKHMVARIHARHTASKKGVGNAEPRESIPEAFWENEKLRLQRYALK
jgi:hypothetical protein